MEIINIIERKLNSKFKQMEEISLANQEKVLNAFKDARVGLSNFAGSTGYGYDDTAKGKLSDIFKSIFHCDGAIVSPLLTSGTHTLNVALSGVLRPGDNFISITGNVYDSLQSAVYGNNIGSLKDFNIKFSYINLINNKFDTKTIRKEIKKRKPKLVYIQRSAGYQDRDTLGIKEIGNAIALVKSIDPSIIIFIDNCYGTFSDKQEPTDVGADIVVGSLIKNAGGGLAPTGGYIVGRADLITLIENRLYGVGLGSEVGSYAYGYQSFFEGVWLAPSVVCNAIKGSMLVGAVLDYFNIETNPVAYSLPKDLIRRVKFNNRDKMISFIRLVQQCSPIDSFVVPEPASMPGYDSEIIMASGGFVQGSSIELSADGPVKDPYIAYFQGGTTYNQVKLFAIELINYLSNLNK